MSDDLVPGPRGGRLRRAWKKGEYPGNRISNDAARAVKMARRLCPAAVKFLGEVMSDPEEAMAVRVRAAETLLAHGMPRGDTSRYMGDEQIGAITLNLVYPKAEEPKVIEGPPLSFNTITVGSGD